MRLSLIFIFIFSCLGSIATIIPSENSRINYTTIYFEEDLQPGAQNYEFVLYSDSLLDEGKQADLRSMSRVPAFRCSDLQWGTRYSWQVNAYDKDHKLVHEGTVHVFRTVNITYSFPHVIRAGLDIKTNKKGKHSGGLLLLDYTRCMYTRDGIPVWTLPDIPGIVGPETQIRDMKLTADNTITFLTDKTAVEIDLDGKILWRAPRGFVYEKDTVIYHHDLKKTDRGTYMVLGTRRVLRPFMQNYTAGQLQNEAEISVINKKVYKKTQMTILLEFDRNGKLVWFWDADSYIKDADLLYKKYETGAPLFSSHSNAFSENAEATTVYIGFRDLSRIVKIDKATKKVTMSYGEKFPSGDAEAANNLFRKQHDGTITTRNTLLIFNNNEAAVKEGERAVSSLIEIKENAAPDDTTLWSFALNFDSQTTGWSSGGGNVTELPNSNFLLCAGTLNRVLEVTRDKEIVWDALIQSFSAGSGAWKPFPQYRCSWLPYLKNFNFVPVLLEKSNAREISLNITNTGNTGDKYLVEVFAIGKGIYKKRTENIPANETLEQVIPLKTLPPNIKKLVIRITSESGKLKKELSLNL